MQRRVNLIPNLVNTVKGYATHEEQTLDEITRARAGLQSALQTRDPTAMANADAQLTSALSRLNVNVEAYPNLKADQLFIRLQDELAGTENRIATARTDYNQAVQQYNAYIRQFPAVLTAKVTGAKEREILHGGCVGAARTADGRLLEARARETVETRLADRADHAERARAGLRAGVHAPSRPRSSARPVQCCRHSPAALPRLALQTPGRLGAASVRARFCGELGRGASRSRMVLRALERDARRTRARVCRSPNRASERVGLSGAEPRQYRRAVSAILHWSAEDSPTPSRHPELPNTEAASRRWLSAWGTATGPSRRAIPPRQAIPHRRSADPRLAPGRRSASRAPAPCSA